MWLYSLFIRYESADFFLFYSYLSLSSKPPPPPVWQMRGDGPGEEICCSLVFGLICIKIQIFNIYSVNFSFFFCDFFIIFFFFCYCLFSTSHNLLGFSSIESFFHLIIVFFCSFFLKVLFLLGFTTPQSN